MPAPGPLRAMFAPSASPPSTHVVRVRRGSLPAPSPLSGFQRLAWRLFRARMTAHPPDPSLDDALARAHMRLRGDEYMAQAYAKTMVAAGVLVAVGAIIYVLLSATGHALFGDIALVAIPVGLTPLVFVVLKLLPGINANSRGKKIDTKISAAMSFVSAMSSADVNVDQIFQELARQKIYGEVAEEAAWITRDTELLGVDILTALKDGASRTPSKNWQDFLQGVVTTATSGGQLKPYFLLKAEQFEQQHKIEMLKRVETMGLLAETFVTAVVAFPLFLVIIIAIFALVGGGGSSLLTILYAVVGIMVPGLQLPFIVIMKSIAAEV